MNRSAAPIAPKNNGYGTPEQIQPADHQRPINQVDDRLQQELPADAHARFSIAFVVTASWP